MLDAIRNALKDRKLSVVAEQTGLSYLTIKKIRDGETKDPSLSVAIKLAEYLGV